MVNGKVKKRRCKARRRLKRRAYKERKKGEKESADSIYKSFKNDSQEKGW